MGYPSRNKLRQWILESRPELLKQYHRGPCPPAEAQPCLTVHRGPCDDVEYVDSIPAGPTREDLEAGRHCPLQRYHVRLGDPVCTDWLKPLYRHIQKQLGKQAVIHADETMVQVYREDEKTNTSESRMWVYASGRYSCTPLRFFEYQPDHSGKHPATLLKDFTGYLVTDRYSDYDKVPKAIRCSCWAHMRRKWRNAMPKEPLRRPPRLRWGMNIAIISLHWNGRSRPQLRPSGLMRAKRKRSFCWMPIGNLWRRCTRQLAASWRRQVTYTRNQCLYGPR